MCSIRIFTYLHTHRSRSRHLHNFDSSEAKRQELGDIKNQLGALEMLSSRGNLLCTTLIMLMTFLPKTSSIGTDECVGVHELSCMYLHILTLTSRTVKLFYNHSCKSCRKELVDLLWCICACLILQCILSTVLKYFFRKGQNIFTTLWYKIFLKTTEKTLK